MGSPRSPLRPLTPHATLRVGGKPNARMKSPSIYEHGTYQYVPDSKVYFNGRTKNVVMVSKAGDIVTGWNLAPGTPQYENYLKNGVLR